MITRLTNLARRASLAFGLLTAAGAGLHAQSSSTNDAASAPGQPPKTLHFRVLDAQTSEPIPGVKVRSWVGTNLLTDQTGSCSIAVPHPESENFSYRITITKPGWVGRYITWAKSRGDKFEDIPADYATKMDKATNIGGVLQSEDGQPLANARILISGVDTSDPANRDRSAIGPSYLVERADENGHWQCAQVPQHFQDMTFRVIHPDYPATTFGCTESTAGGSDVVRLPAADFLSGNAAMYVGHGLVLSGVVVDKTDSPVSGASITRNHEWRDRDAILHTDAQGHFKISDLQPGFMILTFQAKGMEAKTVEMTITNQVGLLRVVMNPGKILKGEIMDDAGKPVSGASIQMDRLDLGPLEYDWEATTGADGRFLWDSAPSGMHPYLITADGYNLRSEPGLVADNTDKTITLHKLSTNAVMDGTVTDSATHEPVTKFSVLIRVTGDNGSTNIAKDVSNSDGKYSVEVNQSAGAFTLEFRAPGYLPTRTDPRSPGDGDQSEDVKLEKGGGLAGVVVLQDGTPVADADVALCTEVDGAEIGGRHIKGIYQTNITTTASDGSFVFPSMPGGHTIFAANDSGFAQLDVTEGRPPFRITLQPWGMIQGTALLGGKPLANADMALQGPLPCPVAPGLAVSPLEFTAKTDAQGRFVISNIPPTELRLGQVVAGFFNNTEYVTVKPGVPTVLQYGGTGAALSGRLEVPHYSHQINWTGDQTIVLVADVPQPDMPKFDNADGEKVWISQFWKSDEGKTWQHTQRAFTATANSDGSFKIEDIPPGNYKLRVQLTESPELGGQRLAALETNITIAASAVAATPAKMDLGMIDVPPAVNLRPGDMAPLFETKTIFGHPLKLADYRGKYVLIDFWATWCGPCVAETPYLKAVYDKFGKDPRFAMMSLSVDAQAAQPIAFVHINDIHWIQGFLGDWNESTITPLYGVDGIPAIFLIGPDGKIIARDLRGEDIDQAITKALGTN